MFIQKLILPGALFALTLSFGFASSVAAGTGKILDQTGCACCPVCDHVCKLDAEEIEEEKTCFEVESKVICIPRVVFPWQKAKKARCAACDSCSGRGCNACVHNGARLRKICVLKPEKYKCPACKYTWTAEKKDCCGSCCGVPTCNGDCDEGCDVGCEAPVYTETASVPQAPSETPVSSLPMVVDYYESKTTLVEPSPRKTPLSNLQF